MSSFIETEIGTYPGYWDVDRVDSAFGIQQGKQVSKKNRVGDNQRPFLRTKNVFWNRLDLEVLDQMHFTEAEESRLAMKEGDLLLCEGGDIGRAAMWRGEITRCYHQNHLHRLRALDARIEHAEDVSRKIREAFVDFPNWQKSESALRELRKEVTFAIFAETDNLDQVTRLVDEPLNKTEVDECSIRLDRIQVPARYFF